MVVGRLRLDFVLVCWVLGCLGVGCLMLEELLGRSMFVLGDVGLAWVVIVVVGLFGSLWFDRCIVSSVVGRSLMVALGRC